MKNGIPDVVRTTIALHEAEAAHRAAKLNADLRGRVIGHTLSRRLREARDQAQQEAEAWAVLLDHVDRPVGQVVGVPEDKPGDVVGFVSILDRRLKLCRDHRPERLLGWLPVTAEDLEHGGLCTHGRNKGHECGRDLLA